MYIPFFIVSRCRTIYKNYIKDYVGKEYIFKIQKLCQFNGSQTTGG